MTQTLNDRAAEYLGVESKVSIAKSVDAIMKGDVPGHPFHGNQYSSGASSPQDHADRIESALRNAGHEKGNEGWDGATSTGPSQKGFLVHASSDGALVRQASGPHFGGRYNRTAVDRAGGKYLEKYAQTLEAKGMHVERVTRGVKGQYGRAMTNPSGNLVMVPGSRPSILTHLIVR